MIERALTAGTTGAQAATQIAIPGRKLPVGSKGHLASGWLGMLTLIATEATLFAYLLFSYFYLASHALGTWPVTRVTAVPPVTMADAVATAGVVAAGEVVTALPPLPPEGVHKVPVVSCVIGRILPAV